MLTFLFEKIFVLLIHGMWHPGKESFNQNGIHRILVIRNDNIGDVLCCTPAIRPLRQAFPKAYIAALVVRYKQDATLGNPDLAEVFVYKKAKHRPDRNRLRSLYRQFHVLRELKTKHFDFAIKMRTPLCLANYKGFLIDFDNSTMQRGYQ